MASKRDFKKYIAAASNAVSQNMMFVGCTVDGVDNDAVNEAIIDILKAAELSILKANVKFDKTPKACGEGTYSKERRAFYKALFKKANKDYVQALNAAIKKFNAAVPEEAKAKNKANA